MGNKLEGKTAVVTGGGSGIGFATTKRFVSEGACIFIIDRNKKELDLVLSDIGKNILTNTARNNKDNVQSQIKDTGNGY